MTASAVVVNPKNVTFVKELELLRTAQEDLGKRTVKLKTWKDAEPVLAGPDNLLPLRRTKDSGTYDFFTEAIGTHKKQRDRRRAERR